MTVEVWTEGFRRCVWRGSLQGTPRQGDSICIDDEHVETVRAVRFQLDPELVLVELVTADAEGRYPEVGAHA